MDAFQILVIVLSVILAINLILGLAAMILVVSLLKKLRLVADKASEVANNVESASEFFKNTSMSAAAIKLVSNVSGLFSHHKDKKGEK